ncbi:MAG: YtxH domain-containing protein [bacterium]
MKGVGDVIGAFLIGVAVGTVIGMLYAPQSGEETRKYISERGSKTIEELNQKMNNLKEQFEKISKEISKTTAELVDKLSDVFEKKQEKQESQG